MARITNAAARIHAFNSGVSYITTARMAHELYTEYYEAEVKKCGPRLSFYCALAYVYWAGLTDGIRQERERRKKK